ncbi:MAG TPA: hypothetical protein VLA93_01075 [Pyrinomonadaceae bacterium]|nr:hypothetical protein [Pyrinomonadaceae bacterium]
MKIKATIAGVVILLLTQTAIAQFGQFGQGRLSQFTARLATEAADLAETSYRNQSNNFRGNRSDVEGMMVAQQFSASAQLLNRMVNDRRRNQDLRDAFQVVQDVARSLERYNIQRNNWYNIQRLMSDISRELNVGSNDNNNQYPDTGRSSGRMTWKGRVDDDIRIRVRGGSTEIETIGGTPFYNATQSFTASLPPRRVNVSLQVKKGRGEVFIEQQPSRENDFTAVVRIRDPKGGASDYEFELSW